MTPEEWGRIIEKVESTERSVARIEGKLDGFIEAHQLWKSEINQKVNRQRGFVMGLVLMYPTVAGILFLIADKMGK